MNAAKVKVALGRYICNVGWDSLLFAKLPNLTGSFRVIYSHKNHVCAIEIGWLKVAIDVCHLSLGNTKGNLGIQPGSRADDCNHGIGVETV